MTDVSGVKSELEVALATPWMDQSEGGWTPPLLPSSPPSTSRHHLHWSREAEGGRPEIRQLFLLSPNSRSRAEPPAEDFYLGARKSWRRRVTCCRVSSHDGTRQLSSAARMSHRSSPARAYDFLLKFLLVGDSDVGKGEILASLQDGATESPYGYNM
eukprot:superscaffoldBa00009686_g24250